MGRIIFTKLHKKEVTEFLLSGQDADVWFKDIEIYGTSMVDPVFILKPLVLVSDNNRTFEFVKLHDFYLREVERGNVGSVEEMLRNEG